MRTPDFNLSVPSLRPMSARRTMGRESRRQSNGLGFGVGARRPAHRRVALTKAAPSADHGIACSGSVPTSRIAPGFRASPAWGAGLVEAPARGYWACATCWAAARSRFLLFSHFKRRIGLLLRRRPGRLGLLLRSLIAGLDLLLGRLANGLRLLLPGLLGLVQGLSVLVQRGVGLVEGAGSGLRLRVGSRQCRLVGGAVFCSTTSAASAASCLACCATCRAARARCDRPPPFVRRPRSRC